MSGCYRVIDETIFHLLGTFTSRGQAVDYVAALLSVNDADFLDELTIANDAGPLLFGDSLRTALRNREAARDRAASSTRSTASHGRNKPSIEAMTAKSHRH